MADLIYLAVVFLVLALVFYILGARGIAGFTMEVGLRALLRSAAEGRLRSGSRPGV